MAYQAERSAVCRTARAMWREGLVRLSEGNVSARCRDGRVAVTPSGLAYAELTPADVVVVDAAGHVVAGARRPTSELAMHLALLAALPTAGAVVHTHSPHAVAFAVCGRPIPAVCSEALLVGPEVPVAPFAPPGTPELAAAAVAALRDGARAALLQNHGVVAVGPDLASALATALYVERTAEACILATAVGRPLPLPPELFRR
jgi:L-fuculose-phosphate aldolase